MNTINKQLLNILLFILTIWVGGAMAEIEMLDENASKQQIRDAFFNKQSSIFTENGNKSKTRGIKVRGIEGFSSEGKKLKELAKLESTKSLKVFNDAGIATAIQFKYNSTELLPGSLMFIKKVGDVLAESDVKFIIEGHTDASGSEVYNLELSELRAIKIKKIFIAEHNIMSDRILTEGKGESSLRFLPNNYKNRRVEIRPLN